MSTTPKVKGNLTPTPDVRETSKFTPIKNRNVLRLLKEWLPACTDEQNTEVLMKTLTLHGIADEKISFIHHQIMVGNSTVQLIEANNKCIPNHYPHIIIGDENEKQEYSVRFRKHEPRIKLEATYLKNELVTVDFNYPTAENSNPSILVRIGLWVLEVNVIYNSDAYESKNSKRYSKLEDYFLSLKTLEGISPKDIYQVVSEYYSKWPITISLSMKHSVLWFIKVINGTCVVYQKNQLSATGEYLELIEIKRFGANLFEFKYMLDLYNEMGLQNNQFHFQTTDRNFEVTLTLWKEKVSSAKVEMIHFFD